MTLGGIFNTETKMIMRKNLNMAILAAITLIITGAAVFAVRRYTDWMPLPYRLALVRTLIQVVPHYPCAQRFTPDPRGDDFVVTWTNEPNSIDKYFRFRIEVYNASLGIVQQLNFDHPIHWAGGVNADGVEGDELLVSYSDDKIAGLRMIKWPSLEILWEFTFTAETWQHHKSSVFDNQMIPGPVVNLGDSIADALTVKMLSGRGGLPRGLLLLNLRTGQEIWHTMLAGSITSIVSGRNEATNTPILVVGTYSPDNGVRCDDTNDGIAYLYGFDGSGVELWRKEFSGPFSRVLVAEYDSTGQEAVVAYAPIGLGPDKGKFMIIRCATGEIEREIFLPETAGIGTVLQIINTKGQRYWCITSATTSVLLEGHNLAQVPMPVYIPGMIELTPSIDGGGHFIGTNRDKILLLCDSNLKILATRVGVVAMDVLVQRVGIDRGALLWIFAPDRIEVLQVRANPNVVMQTASVLLGLLLGSSVLCFGSRELVRMRFQFLHDRRERVLRASLAVAAGVLERHEVTSPITTALREAMNIRQEIKTLPSNGANNGLNESVNQIIGELARARDSLNPLIQILRSDPPSFRWIDINDALMRIVDKTPLPSNVSIKWELTDSSVYANIDESWFSIAMRNLLENSVKAMSGGGTIIVRVGQERSLHEKQVEKGQIKVQIADNGRGISREHFPHIFELGYTQTSGGKGIGLWLVKHIIDAHHAQIRCDSILGSGTTFTILLPKGE